MTSEGVNNLGFGGQPYYQPDAGDTLFNNLNGRNGRLPPELVAKLKEACQRNGLNGNLDGDMRESWFDIFSNVDGQRIYVGVKDARNGPIIVSGGFNKGFNGSGVISPDVMTLLRQVSSELAQQ
jgi:hypothetical protein